METLARALRRQFLRAMGLVGDFRSSERIEKLRLDFQSTRQSAKRNHDWYRLPLLLTLASVHINLIGHMVHAQGIHRIEHGEPDFNDHICQKEYDERQREAAKDIAL